ncbi:MAG: amidohydrolase [Chlorobi bacterium]|nr:amidohydrolase [Chlorobiota bacterium]
MQTSRNPFLFRIVVPVIIVFLVFQLPAQAQTISARIDKEISQYERHLDDLYLYLHQHPELSFMETNTSARMQQEAEDAGFTVTPHFGGNSLVAVLKNGRGPVIMVRTDMDALPLEEKTDLPYASRVVTKTREGVEMHAMHACGHDIHMSVWSGVAHTMAALKDQWHGTLIMIAQQAEERSGGAREMIKAGIFRKFPVPGYILAFHVMPDLPVGTVGYGMGPVFAGVNSVDITVYGKGGHGAYPHKTIDPIVLSARTIMAFQTIVSRELNPLDPAVISVGSIHGGTKHNIIPDEVKMQITVRFYKDEVFNHIKNAMERITKGIAISAGLPEDRWPVVHVADEFTPPLINNPGLAEKCLNIWKTEEPALTLQKVDPQMAGEDFSLYGRTPEKIPVFMFRVGTASPDEYAANQTGEKLLPALHSPHYAPHYKEAIPTGIRAMASAVIGLFQGK